jgi:type IV secretion system protein TrbL
VTPALALAPALDLCAIPGLSSAGCAVRSAVGALTPGGLAGGAVGALGTSMLAQIADSFFNAWWLFQSKVLTFWTEAPTPGPADLVAPGSTRRWVAWLAQFALIISVLIAAGRTILTRDGRNLADAGRALVLTILTSALVVTVAAALVAAGDAIANALLGDALAEGFGADPAPIGAALLSVGGPPGLVLLGSLGFLASVVQFFVLLSRNAVLPVVIVLLPLAAAAGGAQLGRAWFGRLAAWLLALAFYKPVAAIIYSVVLVQARTADTAMAAITALVGMCMAILALPALIKLFTPSAAGGGGSGGGYAAGMAGGAAVRAAASRGGSA